MSKIKIISLVMAVLVLSGCAGSATENKSDTAKQEKQEMPKTTVNQNNNSNMEYVQKYQAAEIETTLGKIKVKFYNEDSPATVNNFLKLADEKFYDGTKFHRVIKDFMIQGGDPNSKTKEVSTWGMGGPGYKLKDEFNSHKLVRGSLAMANSGPNTNGSQFFIVTAEATPWLDGKHTNFGEVIEGMDVVAKIENVKTGAADRPVQDVVIKNITLLEK